MILMGMSAALIMISIKYYDKSYMMLYINGKFSRIFRANIGATQSGPASPGVWKFYCRRLQIEIRETNIGVRFDLNKIIGSITFAYDTTLLATSVKEAISSLEITDKFGIKQEITYNGDKTDLIIVSGTIFNEDISDLKLNGNRINRSNELKFLGYMLSGDNTNTVHINNRIDKSNKGLFSLHHTGISSN